jgi:chromate transporter
MTKLVQLAGVFGLLSILAVGGGTAVLPEMKSEVVARHQWLSSDQFIDIYSLGQLTPGPNMLMVQIIGERVAGVPGALIAVLAFFVPAGLLTWATGRLWQRLAAWPWRQSIQRGLAPVAIGLMLAGTVTIARIALADLRTVLIAAAVTGILLSRHVNPAYLILASGLLGAVLLGA